MFAFVSNVHLFPLRFVLPERHRVASGSPYTKKPVNNSINCRFSTGLFSDSLAAGKRLVL